MYEKKDFGEMISHLNYDSFIESILVSKQTITRLEKNNHYFVLLCSALATKFLQKLFVHLYYFVLRNTQKLVRIMVQISLSSLKHQLMMIL